MLSLEHKTWIRKTTFREDDNEVNLCLSKAHTQNCFNAGVSTKSHFNFLLKGDAMVSDKNRDLTIVNRRIWIKFYPLTHTSKRGI